MGAWGTGSFENDTALDWLYEFEQEGASAIAAVFEEMQVAQSDGYIDADVGSMMLAACEVVAASYGKALAGAEDQPGSDGYATLADILISAQEELRAESDLPSRCVAALQRVTASDGTSELQELWAESELDAWMARVADLRTRLEGIGQ